MHGRHYGDAVTILKFVCPTCFEIKSRSTASARLFARHKVHGLVMVFLVQNFRVIAFSCTQQVGSLLSTAMRQTFHFHLWPVTLTSTLPRPLTLTSKQGKWWQWSQNTFSHCLTLTFDLRPWPTYDPMLARVEVDPNAHKNKVVCQMVQPWECPQTNRWTDGPYQIYNFPASIKVRGQ